MKQLLLLLCLFVAITGSGQTLRRKFLGVYEGSIPAYTLDLGSDVVAVEAAVIRIELGAATIVQTIGTTTKTGTWRVLSESREGYVIAFRLEGQLIEEQLLLIRKGKRLLRKGVYPQPDAALSKL